MQVLKDDLLTSARDNVYKQSEESHRINKENTENEQFARNMLNAKQELNTLRKTLEEKEADATRLKTE